MEVYRIRWMKSFLWSLFLLFIVNISLLSCKEALEEERADNESRLIEGFISKNKWNFEKENGVYHITRNTCFGYHVAKGDTITFNYVAYTLDGLVFETNVKAEAKKAGLDTTVRSFEPLRIIAGKSSLIEGLEEGLLLLKEGEVGTIVFPSTKGYGGSAIGPIKPNSPIAFNIELISVNNAKIEQEISYISSLNLIGAGYTYDATTGLYFKFSPEGVGVTPTLRDTIYCWYKGTKFDGTVIEEIKSGNIIVVLSSSGINDGLKQGFLKTKKGGTTDLVLPSYLGFGNKGNEIVKSYETLKYQIRLDSIK